MRSKFRIVLPVVAASALYLNLSTSPVMASAVVSAKGVVAPHPDPNASSWLADKVGGWLVGKALEYFVAATADLGCQKDLDALTSVVQPPGTDSLPVDALDGPK